MTLTLHPLETKTYVLWLRLMLGMACSPCAMRDADILYRRQGPTIRRFARLLADAFLPRIWHRSRRTLYRGLLLSDPTLSGHPLPPHRDYDALPTLSFTENPRLAAYFADSGPCGMPVPSIIDLSTGAIRPGLPEHGYVGSAVVAQPEVLFHWRYVQVLPWLVAHASTEEIETVLYQQEVTVLNSPALRIQLHALNPVTASHLVATSSDEHTLPPANEPATP